MALPGKMDLELIRREVLTTVHGNWKLLLFNGVITLILGLLAIALPKISTLEIELLVGWLLVVGGFIRNVTFLRKPQMPGFCWSLLCGVLAVVLGVLLIGHPLRGIVTLTAILTIFFMAEGAAAIFVALNFRPYLKNWGWTLASGLINLVLAGLIWKGWPNTAKWVIGLYLGINMIFLGLPMIMTALAARSVRSTLA